MCRRYRFVLFAVVLTFCGSISIAVPDAVAQAGGQRTALTLARCDTQIATLSAARPLPSKDSAVVAEYLRRQAVQFDSVKAAAKACLAALDPVAVPDSMLGMLAELQRTADRVEDVPATIARVVQSHSLGARERLDAVNSGLATLPASPATLALARRAVTLADTVGNPSLQFAQRTKVATIIRTVYPLEAYLEAEHAVDFLKTVKPDRRKLLHTQLASLVYMLGQWAVEDSTPTYLSGFVARAVTAMGDAPEFVKALQLDLHRVTAVGAPAKPFESKFWINVPVGTRRWDLANGHVTLVEFTAEWCAACKPSYKPIQAMYKELRSQGFDAIFCVPRVGPDDKLQSKYHDLFSHYGVEFPIVVAEDGAYDTFYSVAAIPHFLIIDRHGIVRDMFLGWDASRAMTRVKTLLAEKE